MKHNTTSLMTKKALAASLKKIMERKPFGKISVREIIEDCGVNRKTFYYHFQDINDLLKWIFEEEAIEIVKQYDLIIDYRDAIQFVLDYVEQNKVICSSAFDALGRDELKRFFQKDFFSVIGNIAEQLSEGMAVPEDYKEFLVIFYTEALASLLISWIRNQGMWDKQKMIQYVSITLFGAMKQALERAKNELN